MKILLASQSPRRKEILEGMGLTFKVCPSHSEEYFDPNVPLEKAIQEVAYHKAKDVQERYPDACVIGADTIVSFQGRIYGKPKDNEEAFQFLRSFSQKAQDVMTGLCILYKDKKLMKTDVTKVWFRSLSDDEIWHYLNTHNALDKAGAYGIQDSDFVSRIEGSMSNVVGLCQESVEELLGKLKDQ